MRLTRRAWLTMLGASSGAAIFASCSPATQATPSPSAAKQPRSGGTLKYGMTANPASLNGHYANNLATFNVTDRLVVYDENLKLLPNLAESWEQSDDQRQIKLNLRKGVTWHSGREFTSDDVKFNMLRVRDPKSSGNNGALASYSQLYTGIETPDKYTIILKSEQPRPGTFDFFQYFFLVDQDTIDDKSKMGCTGPFKFVEYVPGDHLTYVKNPSYWRSGRPYLDQIVMPIVPDAASRVTQIESGALEGGDVSLRDAVRLETNSAYRVTYYPDTSRHVMMVFNCISGPTANKRFRQGLAWSIDRKRWAETTLLGKASPYSMPWPKSSPAYDPAKEFYFGFDLDKARALIGDSGVPSTDIEVVVTSSESDNVALAQIWQADLAKIGVKLTVRPLERTVYLSTALATQFKGAVIGNGGFAQLQDPTTYFVRSGFINPLNGTSGYRNARYTELVNQSATEPDPAKRKALCAQLNDFYLDEVPATTVAAVVVKLISSARVHGLTLDYANPLESFRDTWLED